MMSQIVQATYGHASLQFDRSAMGSLRVVSNLGDSDRGAGENTRAQNSGEMQCNARGAPKIKGKGSRFNACLRI